MNKLETAFERLRAEGWYCAWGLPCCQTCAWDEVSCEDDIDLEKVLFNHEQDIEDAINGSLFCFSGSKEGVKNLIEVLPIFEECGVKVLWNQNGYSRIELEW